MEPIRFRGSVVARRHDGSLVIGLFDGLPAPLQGLDTCVALLECESEAFEALFSVDNVGVPGNRPPPNGE